MENSGAVAWILTASLLSAAVAAVVCGRLGDLYGRREVLLAVLPLAALGSLISALSTTLSGLIAGGFLRGAAGAILPLCLSLVKERQAAPRIPMSVSLIIMAAAVSAGLGMAVGGIIIDKFGWRGIFWLSSSCAMLSAILVAVFIPRVPLVVDRKELKLWSGLLFAPGLAELRH
jgi:MFS family permease